MNQTTSVNSFNDYKLVNFNVPNYLISKFDDLVKFKRKSRTSILLTLMESYLREELLQMKKDNELTQSFKSIKEKYDNPKPKRVVKEKPMIPHSSDDDFMNDEWWNDRIQRS